MPSGSDYTPNNTVIVNNTTLYPFTKFGAADAAFKIGRAVCFSGATTNNTLCDYIRKDNRDVLPSDDRGTVGTTDLIQMNCGPRPGDSGGPVGNNEVWMGIVHSGPKGYNLPPYAQCGSQANGVYMLFSPAYNVPSALGITISGLAKQTTAP